MKLLTPEISVKDKKLWEIVPVMELEFRDTQVELRIQNSLHNSQLYHTYIWHDTDRIELAAYKNAFKRFLYTALSEETGISLPWGNLTGFVPPRLP